MSKIMQIFLYLYSRANECFMDVNVRHKETEANGIITIENGMRPRIACCWEIAMFMRPIECTNFVMKKDFILLYYIINNEVFFRLKLFTLLLLYSRLYSNYTELAHLLVTRHSRERAAITLTHSPFISVPPIWPRPVRICSTGKHRACKQLTQTESSQTSQRVCSRVCARWLIT